ncbi:MAG: EAL domain-containing protein [Geminicoccaceae bacterium]|nr:EAL domain-containing protein [Geminicoccaceae bacterium]
MANDAKVSTRATMLALGEAAPPFRGEGAVVALDGHRRTNVAVVPSLVAPPRGEPCRVLVASGEEETFTIVRDLLARIAPAAYRVEWAVGGEAALRRLGASHYDVAIVEEHLPDGEAVDFVRVAQRRGFRTPVVLVSDDLDALDPAAAIELGIGDLLEREELDIGRLVRSLRFAIARKARIDRLDHLAQYDDLTGLANRSLLRDRLERALAAARRHRTHVAVMVLDLDRFKAVNDSFGHAAGDRVLCVVAERLRGRVRETDTVARLGGDEFTLVVENLARPEHATLVARKLLDALEPPIRIETGDDVRIGASLGVALYPRDGADPGTLVRLADAAMYAVKAQGGHGCRFHDPSLDQRMRRGSILERDLRRALEGEEFVLHFQPQVTLCGEEIGLAAILRWQHPELGLIEAERFRAVAEESGLIDPLTDWIVRGAVERLREWRDAGLGELHVSVPVLSRRQLLWSDLGARLAACLDGAGLPRFVLELELEERLVLEEIEAGGEGLRALVDLGMRLALDRFGAGVASLRLLRDAPLRTLKIAREIIRGVPHDAGRTVFARALVGLAKELGLRVVVDGIDSRAQLKFLKSVGCDAVQAVISCPPLPPDACAGWLREAATRDGAGTRRDHGSTGARH